MKSQEPRQSDASSSQRSGKRGRREKRKRKRVEEETTRSVGSSQGKLLCLPSFSKRKKKRIPQINGSHLLATLEMKSGPRWLRCHIEASISSCIAICRTVIGQWLAGGCGGGRGGRRRGAGGTLTSSQRGDQSARTEASGREAPPPTVNFLAYWGLMSQFVARNMLTCSAS